MQPVAAPNDTEALRKSNKRKLTWGIICLVGPTVLIIAALLLYAVLNFLFFSAAAETPCPTDITGGACAPKDELFAQPSPAQTIANVVLFLIGAVGTLSWLPGIIVGIILLASRKPDPQQ